MIYVLIGFGIYIIIAGILWYYVLKMMNKEEWKKEYENNKENTQ